MTTRLLKIEIATELITEECSVCHVIYAMPKEMNEECHNYGKTFYCPNGHNQVYTQSEVYRLRHKLDQTEGALSRANERLAGALNEITSKKREITRIKNRVHNGVCTECKRHFMNLERHMKTKHPKLSKEG